MLSIYNCDTYIITTTRNFRFRDGKNPSLNCANSITEQIRDGFCNRTVSVSKYAFANLLATKFVNSFLIGDEVFSSLNLNPLSLICNQIWSLYLLRKASKME